MPALCVMVPGAARTIGRCLASWGREVCLAGRAEAGLIVMINIHWDGGWMQPTATRQDEVNRRLASYWTQIATHFKDHDEGLLFAGTNEVGMEGTWQGPTAEYAAVQNSFNQTFVNTVRATGGNPYDENSVLATFNYSF